MMGFRPSFFLFLFIAAPATGAEVEFVPFPLAPVIRGIVAEGAVGYVACMSADAVGFDTVVVAGAVAAPDAVSEFVLPFVLFIVATSRSMEHEKMDLCFSIVPMPKPHRRDTVAMV
jgi:hypothetical protein